MADLGEGEAAGSEDIRLSASYQRLSGSVGSQVTWETVNDALVTNRRRITLFMEVGKVNIYIGNLPLEMTEDELRGEFVAFGQVKSVSVMNDKYIGSGQPRGYGFVEMASKSEGIVAVTGLKGKTMGGRVIEVIEALPLSDNKNKGPLHSRRGSRFNLKRQREYQE